MKATSFLGCCQNTNDFLGMFRPPPQSSPRQTVECADAQCLPHANFRSKVLTSKTVHKPAGDGYPFTLTNGIRQGLILRKTTVFFVVPGHVAMAFPSPSLLGVPLGPLVFLPHHMHACSSGCKKDETSFPE